MQSFLFTLVLPIYLFERLPVSIPETPLRCPLMPQTICSHLRRGLQDPWSLGDVPLNISEYVDLIGADSMFARSGEPVHDAQVRFASRPLLLLLTLPRGIPASTA